jgi:hypothetical protein
MKIILKPEVALVLEAIVGLAGYQEFSGFGFVNKVNEHLEVYEFVLLDVGSAGYSEIGTADMIKLMERPDVANCKLWVHKHGMGNGIPGPQNWSLTDNETIEKSPLGGVPQLVGWSASIVRTPKGWVGRVDNHITKKTVHVGVEPAIPLAVFQQVSDLKISYLRKLMQKVEEKQKSIWDEAMDAELMQVELPLTYLDEEIIDDDEFLYDEEEHDDESWTDDSRWEDAGYTPQDLELPGWSYVSGRDYIPNRHRR